MSAKTIAEAVDATKARASLGEILARARYGRQRFVIQQRGDPAAVVDPDLWEDAGDFREDVGDFRDDVSEFCNTRAGDA